MNIRSKKMKKSISKNAKNKNQEISSPKGMRDLMNEEYYNFQGFFEKAQEVAVYYGFKPIDTPILEHENIFTSSIGEHTDPLVRAYIEHGMQTMPQPVMFYQYGPTFRHDKPQRGRYRQFWQFDLDSLGSDKSIMDALVIKAGLSALYEAGAEKITIEINSIGDKECRNGYLRELTSYYRKHMSNLAPIDRERLKTNPLRILDSKEEKTKEINAGAPDPVSFLCASCKKHFKEVLEYLEELGIDYNINKNLVRGLSYYTRTVFEVYSDSGEEGVPPMQIASGGRYDYHARQIGGKRDVPAVGFSIGVDRVVESKWYKKLSPRIIKKPKIYFIQLGAEAKLKSLNIIEALRKDHIPIAQSISKDSLASQLAIAEKLAIPYALIFGVKEAIENSVIVRDMSNRSQDTGVGDCELLG